MIKTSLSPLVHAQPHRAMRVVADAIATTGSTTLAARVLGVHPCTLRGYASLLGEREVWEMALERMRGGA
jgi:hypothetical protein